MRFPVRAGNFLTLAEADSHYKYDCRWTGAQGPLRKPYFVEVADPRGVGLCLGADDHQAEVEFFYSTSRQERTCLPLKAIRRAYLPRQTRVYYRLGDKRWRMGRVRDYLLEDDGAVTYEVRCPNRDDRDVPESCLRVRCSTYDGDPAEVLALGAAETQRWFDARWPARESLIGLEEASQGLTGLVSASVEIVGHQADAVRRILHDPLQRYLLADEVGLGKTIEAGAVLRQTLIDDRKATALVLAPDALVGQWACELEERFGLSGNREPRLALHRHADLDSGLQQASLVVVDEAHRLIDGAAPREGLMRLARGAKKLLLLSATPVIGHEAALLGLLSLLDPERWASEPIARFRAHVEQAQEYGRLLLGLRPDASAFVLKQRVAAARSTFADDRLVKAFADEFEATSDLEMKRRIAGRLREHVADTYRIHHRIIRARRSDLEGWEFQPRGPATLREEEDDDRRLAEASVALEDWRAQARLYAQTAPEAARAIQERYADLLLAVAAGTPVQSHAPGLFTGEAELLAAIDDAQGADAGERRAAFIAAIAERHLRFLRGPGLAAPKLVVFSSYPDLLPQIASELEASVGLAVFEGGTDPSAVRAFRAASAPAVLILGPAGEEGLNLHFADAILHADLPVDISRVEQRIGRLDRFGRTKGPIRHIIISPAADDDTPWSAWLCLLRDAFKIFNRPVSDIQFALHSIEGEVLAGLLDGPSAAISLTSALEARIEVERTRLDEQYALDQLALSRESARDLVEAIEAAEADEGDLENRVDAVLAKTLQFKRSDLGGGMFDLQWDRETQLPERPWADRFFGALQYPLTWRRRVSIAHPEARLVRPGSALIDALQRLLDWDDRGSAFATWRFDLGGGGPGEERLAFRLCWIVGPGAIDASRLRDGESADALRRFAQSLSPRWTFTQHVGPDLELITDAAWLSVLERPFAPEASDRGGRDFNLGSRPDWLRSVIDRLSFAKLCAAVRDDARARLIASPEYQTRVEAGRLATVRALERRTARRAVQASAHPSAALEREALLDEMVAAAVERPEARLDCVGAIIVASHVPGRL
jgi:ATP-dependent helicase HepA